MARPVPSLQGDNTLKEKFMPAYLKQAMINLKADKAITLTAGSGLTGGGDLSANRSLAVVFGTTSGTVTQGNDSRLSDARTPVAHTHALTELPTAWVKESVKVATTANITLSGTQTIDGVAVVAGDRVLVKNQSTQNQNGIYTVAAGSWTRAADAASATMLSLAEVGVESGTAGSGTRWRTTFQRTNTIGTSNMIWYQVPDARVLDKTWVGLDNVDNTSDLNKPVSTAVQNALAGKISASVTINAGTGLSGGGDLTASRTLSVVYGTTAGTAAQGNDARLSDARTPLTHSHAIADLPVAASGVSSSTLLVRADDSRLSDARTPLTHTHALIDISGAWVKQIVKVASTGNLTLSGTQTVDGVALVDGDRILVKNQTNAAQNGVYVVAAGAWTRSVDMDTAAEVANATVAVDRGTQGGQIWSANFKSTDTLGTTNLSWVRLLDTDLIAVHGGTTAGTVVQASDPRLSDARTPVAHTHAAADITSGVLATARLGSGTANATVWLRGDGTWASIPGQSLANLTDTTISTPATGQLLRYNGTAWVNYTFTKSDVGLSNVDNTSDANKPVSTATQTALNLKADRGITISAGTGLTGGGDLTANRSLAVVYGTAAGTAAQGNDSRLSDSRTPTGAAGGSLSGTYPNPAIAAGAVNFANLATAAVAASGVSSSTAVVRADDSRLSNSRTPTGTAGGVLSGTYPNPGFAASPTFTGTTTVDALNTTGTVNIGNADTDVTLDQSVLVEDHARSVEVTYDASGNLETLTEKAGTTTVRTYTNTYTDGSLTQIVEVAGGKTITSTLNYNNGVFASITRSVA